MIKEWKISEPIPESVEKELGELPSELKQLLYNRNIKDPASANIYLKQEGSLYDPFLFKGMRRTVRRIWKAIDRKEKIAIYGDYDVDGVTATALLVQVIKRLGGCVRHYIPNRFDEGYGLNKYAISKLNRDHVRLIITVDCGIRSIKEGKFARDLGVDLIISDHHDPKGNRVPVAKTVICPKRAGDTYPDKFLSGVGLAYKIAEAMLKVRKINNINVNEWLDLVAVGTVADMVPLVDENRALVKAGLRMLKEKRRPSINKMLDAAEIATQNLTARDIGFVIGPRLNAAGRLDSALKSYEFLMTEDPEKIGLLVQELDNKNRLRQDKTRQMYEYAENSCDEKGQQDLIIISSPDFEMGIVGLVASRLVDAHYRPAIVGSIDGAYTRASCRSIPQLHITNALDQCADLFKRHGGHAMAAGFTILTEKWPLLEERLSGIIRKELEGKEVIPYLEADMEIDLNKMSMETGGQNQGIRDIFDALDSLEPTGMENRSALFMTRNLAVKSYKWVGKDGNHLNLSLSDGISFYRGIAFKQLEWKERVPSIIDIIYSFEKNYFRGKVELQLNIKALRPSAPS